MEYLHGLEGEVDANVGDLLVLHTEMHTPEYFVRAAGYVDKLTAKFITLSFWESRKFRKGNRMFNLNAWYEYKVIKNKPRFRKYSDGFDARPGDLVEFTTEFKEKTITVAGYMQSVNYKKFRISHQHPKWLYNLGCHITRGSKRFKIDKGVEYRILLHDRARLDEGYDKISI